MSTELKRALERIAELKAEKKRYRQAMQEFVERCERGLVRSTYTYTKFRCLLGEYTND